MIAASIFSSPEVLWGAIVSAVGSVGAGAYKIINLEHRVNTLEGELEETKGDVKEDLTYLRDRMDKIVQHLMETSNV